MPTIKLTKRALDGIKPGGTIGFWYVSAFSALETV